MFAQASQPLSQLWKIHLQLISSKIGEDLARESLRQQRQDTVHSVRDLYYQIAQTQTQSENAEANEKYLAELQVETDRPNHISFHHKGTIRGAAACAYLRSPWGSPSGAAPSPTPATEDRGQWRYVLVLPRLVAIHNVTTQAPRMPVNSSTVIAPAIA